MSALCTEARASVRESLRIARLLQTSPHAFEALCFRFAASRPGVFQFAASGKDKETCGNFVKCFTSLFLPEKEITRVGLDAIIDGSAIKQLASHPNLLLHSWVHEAPYHYLPASSRGSLSTASGLVAQLQASSSSSLLSAQLLRHDEDAELPRVFLVSCSWVHLQKHMPTPPTDPFDHKFVLCKHSNDNFQLLQNYIRSSGGSRDALSLRAWQASRHPFCSIDGFNRADLGDFLGLLASFASGGNGAAFCASNHESLFGVRLGAGRGEGGDRTEFWPSLSYTELGDEHIRGSGSRCMANQLELDCRLPL